MLRICLVGYMGYWAKNLKRAIENTPGVKLNALVDPVGEEDGVLKFKSLTPALDQCDVVVVATPPHTHYGVAKEAIEYGRHVLIEKPITTCSKQAKELVELAAKHNVKIGVDHTFLFSQHIRVIKNLIQKGKIGTPLRIVSQRLNLGKFQDSGVVWDLAPHDIAMTNFLFDMNTITPTVKSVDFFDHVEKGVVDTARIGMNYVTYSGQRVSYDLNLSWLFPKKVRSTSIVGDCGMIDYDMLADSPLKLYDKKAMKGDITWNHSFNWVSDYQGEAKEPLLTLIEEFRDHVVADKPFVSDGYVGLEVVELIEKILAAGKNS